MSIIGNIIDTALYVLQLLIFARIILSFIPHDPYNPIFRFVYETTEPMLRPFRRFSLNTGGFGIDFSPLIVLFLLQYLVRPVLYGLLGLIGRMF